MLHASSTRRGFLAGAAALATTPFLPRRVLAATPVHTFKHGDFEISVVTDGALTLPLALHGQDTPPEERAAFLKEAGFTGDTLNGQVNITLLRAGNELILFDTGCGSGFGPTVGKVVENLSAAGIDPGSITKVVFTHGHPDHLWGNADAEGGLRFPNATYVSAASEWDFWTAADLASKLPEGMQQMAGETQRQYRLIKDKVAMVKPGDDLITGIRVLDTKGHTPGHVSFEVAGGEGLIIVGDVIAQSDIYFAHPEWKFGYDAIHEQAVESRKQLLDRAATDRIKLLGYHWNLPSIGYAERKGTAYRYVPAA